MTLKTTALAALATLLAASSASAAALGTRQPFPPLQSSSCPDSLTTLATAPVECATLPVPLDYHALHNSTIPTPTLPLALLRVPASRTPKKGSILVNFGGPGLTARDALSALAAYILAWTGGHYDIIGWDPRGTGDTLVFECFETSAERQSLAASMPYFGNSSDLLTATQNWASSKAYANACELFPDAQDRGRLVGTAYTARDAMQIVDAVEDDGLLRYWGFSYGTALGSTIAAMFPDRVDKVVLDAVMNVHEYYHGFDYEIQADADATLNELIRSCFDVPENCSLAHGNNTPSSVQTAFWTWFTQLKFNPVVVGAVVMDQSRVAGLLRPLLYSPGNWPAVSILIDGAVSGNETRLAEGFSAATALLPAYAEGLPNDAPNGIHGSDKAARVRSVANFLPVIDRFEHTSKLVGPMMAAGAMRFAQWPYVARERYVGDFSGVRTRKPLLFVGNAFDPVTPLRSAHNVSAGFEDSVVLEHAGVGHVSISHPSVCIARAIQAFFNDGTLPERGTRCEPAVPPFRVGPDTWNLVLPEIGFESLGKRSFGEVRFRI